MSIFGSIVSAIFGTKPAGTAAAAPSGGGSAAAPSAGAAATGKPMSKAEVEAMIEKIADAQDEDLNWEESIVDLMKLLKLDSNGYRCRIQGIPYFPLKGIIGA